MHHTDFGEIGLQFRRSCDLPTRLGSAKLLAVLIPGSEGVTCRLLKLRKADVSLASPGVTSPRPSGFITGCGVPPLMIVRQVFTAR